MVLLRFNVARWITLYAIMPPAMAHFVYRALEVVTYSPPSNIRNTDTTIGGRRPAGETSIWAGPSRAEAIIVVCLNHRCC
ncbi:hypothetical protein BDR07DRAFT_1401150 [Suillus spraguei]|nr:hypothetical protein BDR07DRAFT_1401150 [Suillus spraguei]